MSEQEDGQETAPDVNAAQLNPAYQPAAEDSIVAVRFVGNTAQVGDFRTKHVDAFQLLALGAFLEMKGRQTIAAIEAEAFARAQANAEREKIAVASRIPTEDELREMPPGIRPAG